MWRQVHVRLRALFRLRRREMELDEEFRFHLTEEMEERIAEGLSPAAARAAAQRDFGNVTLIRELTRQTWGWGRTERLYQDARAAIRGMPRGLSRSLLNFGSGDPSSPYERVYVTPRQQLRRRAGPGHPEH